MWQKEVNPVQENCWKTNVKKNHPPSELRYRISSTNPFEPLVISDDGFETVINDDKYICHLAKIIDQLKKDTNTKNNQRRSQIVNNRLKGNNKQILDRKQHKSTVPQNGNYSDAIKYECKTVVIRTSMMKAICMKEFNKSKKQICQLVPGANMKLL